MHARRRSEQAVDRLLRRGRIQAAPSVRDVGVNGKHTLGELRAQLVNPCFEYARLRRIAPSNALDSSPDLPERQDAETELFVVGDRPGRNRRIPAPPNFRYDVGVEQEPQSSISRP